MQLKSAAAAEGGWRMSLAPDPTMMIYKVWLTADGTGDNDLSIASLEFEPADLKLIEGGKNLPPTLVVNETDTSLLRTMMDCLWKAGVRPTTGFGDEGEMNALKAECDALRDERDWLRGVVQSGVAPPKIKEATAPDVMLSKKQIEEMAASVTSPPFVEKVTVTPKQGVKSVVSFSKKKVLG